jgi:O-antigen/teichoic acid export membrane protein
MLKKYLSDIAFMQVLNLLIKPIWILVIDRAVQNALPIEVYGNYAALFNFSLMFFIVLDLGLNGYNTTQVSRDNRKIASLTGNILGLKIVLMGGYMLITFGIGLALGYTSGEFGLLLLLCVLQIATSMSQYLRSIVSSLQRFKWDGVFMVLDRVLVVLLVAMLLWSGWNGWELTIHRFVYAQLAGVGLVVISLLIFLRSDLEHVKLSFSIDKIKPLLKKSWPFALLVALMGLFNYVDSVMLKYLVGDAEAGVYALGYRLFYAVLMFAQIFSGVLLPFFSKNIRNTEAIRLIGSYTIKFLMLVGITTALICTTYQTELMQMLYPDKWNANGAHAFSLLMFGFLGSALVLVYGTLLTAALELKFLNIAAFGTLCINLLLNIQLIPAYGATGAAAATLVSQLLFGGICYLIAFRKYGFKVVPKAASAQAIGVLCLVLAIYFGKQYLENIYVRLTMITISILIAGYLFKLYNAKDLKTVLRK